MRCALRVSGTGSDVVINYQVTLGRRSYTHVAQWITAMLFWL